MEVWIVDMGFTFGTFVNGKQITNKTLLRKHDRVKLGMQLFHWKEYLGNDLKVKENNPINLKDLLTIRGTVRTDLNTYYY